jgi:PST family polysaccharide transporter
VPAVWLGIILEFDTVWHSFTTTAISIFTNTTQVGLYTPAVNYVGIGDMAVIALMSAFSPIVSRAVRDRGISKKEFSKYFGYFAAAGLVIVGVTYAFGGPLMIFAFGPKFAESIVFINILIIGFAFYLIAIPTSMLLNVTKNQKVHVLSKSFLLWIGMPLVLILTPRMGALGAAYATTISQSVTAVFSISIALYFLKRTHYL